MKDKFPEIETSVERDIQDKYMPTFSWDYENYSVSDHWFSLAWTYLNCSSHIFAKILDDSKLWNFHYTLVPVHLFEHALELFFKGGIIQAGKTPTGTHDNKQLLKEFKNLYPGNKYSFQGVWLMAIAPTRSGKKSYGEFDRYPTDKSWNIWIGNWHFNLVSCYKQTCVYKDDFQRLIPLLKKKYPDR